MKRSTQTILAICGPILLIIVGCYAVCAPTSFCSFVDRWVSSPDYSPDGERIAFRCHYPTLGQVLGDAFDDLGQSSSLLQWGYIRQATEICTVRADGSHLVRLTYNRAVDGLPVWSPDEQFIAYISEPPYIPGSSSEPGVYVMEEDGSQSRMLSGSYDVIWEKPAWSPDGNRICFAARSSNRRDLGINLYEVLVESGDVHELTTLPGDELGAHWSPDGTQLAFIWFPDGYGGACLTCSRNAAIRLINGEGNNNVVVDGFANIDRLTWSPDETHLAFWGCRSVDRPCDDCAEIYTVDLLSNSTKCLTEQYELVVTGETVWSPDGERIAFTARASKVPAIYTITPDGDSLLQVTHDGYANRELIWAPNGQTIAFVRGNEGEKSHIWLVTIEDSELRKLNIP